MLGAACYNFKNYEIPVELQFEADKVCNSQEFDVVDDFDLDEEDEQDDVQSKFKEQCEQNTVEVLDEEQVNIFSASFTQNKKPIFDQMQQSVKRQCSELIEIRTQKDEEVEKNIQAKGLIRDMFNEELQNMLNQNVQPIKVEQKKETKQPEQK